MAKFEVKGKWFCGHEISEYGQEHGYVDYATLAQSFDAVLNNTIIDKFEYWETVNGSMDYYMDNDNNVYSYSEAQDRIDELQEEYDKLFEEICELDEDTEEYDKLDEKLTEIQEDMYCLEDRHVHDIYQYFIISDAGASILSDYTDEIVLYNSEADINLWCITHWGTAWTHVLTDIRCNTDG